MKAYCWSTPVSELRPLGLKAFRQTLVDAKLARSNINHTMNRLRHIVKWGVENELASAAVLADLKCVAPLRYGKTEAKETEPVKPVHDAYLEAIREHVPRQIWAMIELQRLAGMRGGEVCQMRTRDINTQGEVWTYEPASHKTRYRGHS